MTAIILLVSTFSLVFALGFQSLNVNRGHERAAIVTSFLIGSANLWLYRYLPDADIVQIGAYLCGGPIGIVCSMRAHRKWMRK